MATNEIKMENNYVQKFYNMAASAKNSSLDTLYLKRLKNCAYNGADFGDALMVITEIDNNLRLKPEYDIGIWDLASIFSVALEECKEAWDRLLAKLVSGGYNIAETGECSITIRRPKKNILLQYDNIIAMIMSEENEIAVLKEFKDSVQENEMVEYTKNVSEHEEILSRLQNSKKELHAELEKLTNF